MEAHRTWLTDGRATRNRMVLSPSDLRYVFDLARTSGEIHTWTVGAREYCVLVDKDSRGSVRVVTEFES